MSIFQAVKLNANIYISSLLKCSDVDFYEGDDAKDFKQEINNCMAFFKQELLLLQPDLVVTLGTVPFDEILEENLADTTLEKMIGQTHTLKTSLLEKKLIPTFHPSFLFRNPFFKAKALQNWIKIAKLIEN